MLGFPVEFQRFSLGALFRFRFGVTVVACRDQSRILAFDTLLQQEAVCVSELYDHTAYKTVFLCVEFPEECGRQDCQSAARYRRCGPHCVPSGPELHPRCVIYCVLSLFIGDMLLT